tara:strand:- start:4531 stop:5052 length:522 start_codon:yes stop_codon:yes gene_type:complete
MANTEEFYNQAFNRPIPGESLTRDPDDPMPSEKAPEFTTVKDASEYIFESLTSEESYEEIINLMAGGMPLVAIAQTLLFSGFNEGKWNPDLVMLLIEPTVYMLMALAERADIDFVIAPDDAEDQAETLLSKNTNFEVLKRLQDPSEPSVDPIIEEQLQQLQPPQTSSLLSMEQ